MRIKRGVTKQARHRSVKASAKGMQKARRRSYKLAKQAITRSLQYAYRDRRNKKRNFRSLWIQRINAAARANNTTYSKLMARLKNNGSQLDRKVLSEIAFKTPETFTAIVKSLK